MYVHTWHWLVNGIKVIHLIKLTLPTSHRWSGSFQILRCHGMKKIEFPSLNYVEMLLWCCVEWERGYDIRSIMPCFCGAVSKHAQICCVMKHYNALLELLTGKISKQFIDIVINISQSNPLHDLINKLSSPVNDTLQLHSNWWHHVSSNTPTLPCIPSNVTAYLVCGIMH